MFDGWFVENEPVVAKLKSAKNSTLRTVATPGIPILMPMFPVEGLNAVGDAPMMMERIGRYLHDVGRAFNTRVQICHVPSDRQCLNRNRKSAPIGTVAFFARFSCPACPVRQLRGN